MTHYFRIRYAVGGMPCLEGRFGQRCRVLARGAMSSVLIEFEDGYTAITNRYAIRRLPHV